MEQNTLIIPNLSTNLVILHNFWKNLFIFLSENLDRNCIFVIFTIIIYEINTHFSIFWCFEGILNIQNFAQAVPPMVK